MVTHLSSTRQPPFLSPCTPLPPSLELSTFALLKASLGFFLGSRKYLSKFIWWMAEKQLAALKSHVWR